MSLQREGSIQQAGQERRTMRRFDMHLPATVRVAGQGLRDLSTETQNVSARGVFFFLDRPLAEGMRIEVTMTFPPHVTQTEPVRVRFTARVVRVETSPTYSGIGVAAVIEEYEFLRSNPSSGFNGESKFGT
jgi:PilZ domain-containing protein